MGIGGSSFKRNDKVPGQGLQTLVDAKALKIKSRQLDRLFHEFNKMCGLTSGDDGEPDTVMDYESFLAYHQIENTPWTDLFFQQMETDGKDGWWNFYQYMVQIWSFLSTSEDNLAALMFTMFDPEGKGVLEVFEVKYLLQLVYLFQPPIFARWAIDKLDLNEEGFVTIAEFVLLVRHHPVLLLPIVNMRKKIRKRTVHSRFWREVAYVRMREFGSISFYDILVMKDAREVKLAALRHLLRRADIPIQYKDKWRDLQAKKEDVWGKRDNITEDLPPETLTDVQKGLRLMFPVEMKDKKHRDQGAFAHLHTDYDDEHAFEQDDGGRLNRLVDSLKAQHARTQSKKSSKMSKKTKTHSSVKPVTPGIPTPAAPEPVGAQSRGTVNTSTSSI